MFNALIKATADDSNVVMFSAAAGSVFYRGLDFEYFVKHLRNGRYRTSIEVVDTSNNFVNTFNQFKKPIVV